MTTAIQKPNDSKRDIRSYIQSDAVKNQIAMVLPKHLTADRMARVACTAILKTPKLLLCKPESLLQALMLCSQAGLEPDGRNAHLIPYGDVVQVIFDWKGLVSLARRNGVQNIAADIVCENDEFSWFRDGDGLHFNHKIDYRKERGEMFAAYCIWKDGEQFDGECLRKNEVDGIRNRSRAGNSGPWVTDYAEMAKKTAVRRASKKWPLDAELTDDDVVVDTAPKAVTAKSVFAPVEVVSESETETPASDDAPPMDSPTPLAQKPAKTMDDTNNETPRQFVCRMLDENQVPFDDLRDFITSQNLAKNADTWATLDDAPEALFAILATPAKMVKIIKTYGKKTA